METPRTNAGNPAIRYLLLPTLGAIAAIVSFAIAAPYNGSLTNRGLSPEDPTSHYTFATRWAEVQYPAFGALLCGSFCLVLATQRKGVLIGILSGVVGTVLGGFVGLAAGNASDMLGIALERRAGTLPIVPDVIWCLVVPTSLALTVAIASGPTIQRVKRGFLAAGVAFLVSGVARQAAGMMMLPMLLQGDKPSFSITSNPADMMDSIVAASLPVWLGQTIAVGVVLGLLISAAETMFRNGSLRLILGRNEGRSWNLDYAINRIGSAEGLEVQVRGMPGVEPLHAQLVRQGNGFFVQALGPTPVLLNGQPVQSGQVFHGSTITLGAANFVFTSGSRSAPYVQPPASPNAYAPPAAVPAWRPPPVQASACQPETPISRPGGRPSDPARPSPALIAPRLVAADGREFALNLGSNTIGRDADNSICVNDSTVSRHHAEILLDNSGARLSDLGSSNGTRVNGSAVQGVSQLKPGDQVQFGATSFSFQS